MTIDKNTIAIMALSLSVCAMVLACAPYLLDRIDDGYDEVQKDYELTFAYDAQRGGYHCYIVFDADKDGYLITEYPVYSSQHMYHKGHNTILLGEGRELNKAPTIVRFFE